jgi:hypothetical protein
MSINADHVKIAHTYTFKGTDRCMNGRAAEDTCGVDESREFETNSMYVCMYDVSNATYTGTSTAFPALSAVTCSTNNSVSNESGWSKLV